MIAAGVGCRRGTSSENIESLVRAALAVYGVTPGQLDALATEQSKADEPGIVGAAHRLAVPLLVYKSADLKSVAAAILTSSARVQNLKGVPAIAEAAALLAAGRHARLLGPRLNSANATCAVAIGDGAIGERT